MLKNYENIFAPSMITFLQYPREKFEVLKENFLEDGWGSIIVVLEDVFSFHLQQNEVVCLVSNTVEHYHIMYLIH